jgi:hypothetical protein
MTKFHRLKFENRNSYQFHLQFYKNACQTIKETVLQLDWGWATPTYMKFSCWNSYIKIRGQPSSNLNSSGLTRIHFIAKAIMVSRLVASLGLRL